MYKNEKFENANMKIKIIGFYDEMAWYSNLIGKVYEASEINEYGTVKVKRGNGRYSYYVGKQDYEII